MTAVHPDPTAAERRLWSFNMLLDVKATAADTAGAFSLVDSRLTAAANPPWHVHDHQDEAFLVLDGEVEFLLAERPPVLARPGDFVFGPRGVAHRFEVRTPEARVLVLSTPAGVDEFFRAVGEPAAADELPTPAAPDVEAVTRIAAAHGITILPPS